MNPAIRRVLHLVILLVAGLVATVLLEIGVVAVLTFAPPTIDLSAGFFRAVALVLALLLVLFSLAFRRLWRRGPRWYPALFAASFFVSHHFLLYRLSNPGEDLLAYNLIIGGGCLVMLVWTCLLYTSPSPRDKRQSRMPSSA